MVSELTFIENEHNSTINFFLESKCFETDSRQPSMPLRVPGNCLNFYMHVFNIKIDWDFLTIMLWLMKCFPRKFG